ncbi:MAG TPA: prepilin-type N-terminal cleavage/methylation domain-containing protein [Chthonomonadaceae bacterium]|nr:prepilin-type N-terminal cleavage/methylation domain-containing protein [Chthonomonadaceae bacterium]
MRSLQGQSRESRAGFTLIELLVVIAIIAILAAILFPVFAQARGKARQITGTSNIKQVALSILMYSQDYDEKWPRTGYGGVCAGGSGDDGTIPPGTCNQYGSSDWQNTTAPYVKNTGLYTSPGDASQESIGWWGDFVNPDGEFSLLMNDLLAHTVPSITINGDTFADTYNQHKFADGGSQAAVNAPSDCILLAEGHGGWVKGQGLPDPNPDASGVVENPIPGAPTENKWHKEQSISGNFTPFLTGTNYNNFPPFFSGLPMYFQGNNFAFCDGHAKWVRTADSNGKPTICSTLPWVKTMDPQQRGVEDTGSYCGNNNQFSGYPPGNSPWGGHQWF